MLRVQSNNCIKCRKNTLFFHSQRHLEWIVVEQKKKTRLYIFQRKILPPFFAKKKKNWPNMVNFEICFFECTQNLKIKFMVCGSVVIQSVIYRRQTRVFSSFFHFFFLFYNHPAFSFGEVKISKRNARTVLHENT